ncbi:MAG: c-type cytochrome domain-containing protein [Planctomycetaceae bacterium]
MRMLLLQFRGVCLVIVSLTATLASADDAFRDRVAPILERRCVRCHSGAKAKGDVDLSSAAGAAKTDGLIVAGKPDESLLMEVVSDSAGGAMPIRSQSEGR